MGVILTLDEAAGRAGVSRNTMSKYLNDAEVKARWFPESRKLVAGAGGAWAVLREELDEWIRERRGG